MTHPNAELLRGTLDMLVLQIVSEGPRHGYSIGQRIQELTQDVLSIEQGSLYPALYRLEKAGLLRSRWGRNPESNRRARIYELTATGRKRLGRDVDGWSAFVRAISQVISPRVPTEGAE